MVAGMFPVRCSSLVRAAACAAVLLAAGSPACAAGNQVPIFDFTGGADPSEWLPINDTTAGGASRGLFLRGPRGDALFTGGLVPREGPAFASVRSPAITEDLGALRGLVIRVRGDGKRYFVVLHTDERFGGETFRARIGTVPDAWTEAFLPFDSFHPYRDGRPLGFDRHNPAFRDAMPALDPSRIRYISLLLAGDREEPFTLAVDRITGLR